MYTPKNNGNNGNITKNNGNGIHYNMVDRLVGYFSPAKALERVRFRAAVNFLDSAYVGASLTSRAMRRWLPSLGAPNVDYGEGTQQTLVARSRDAYRNQAIARAAVDRLKHNVVGTGLNLNSTIDWTGAGITKEQAAEKERELEREFGFWARSQEADLERQLNFAGLQTLVLVSTLISGDVFANTPMFARSGSPYLLKCQIIEGDRVSNPNLVMDTKKITRGVEMDAAGAPVAYHIRKAHPGDSARFDDANVWQRVRAFGVNTGRRRVLHVFDKERPGAVRGVPILAPILEKLKQLDRYGEAEIAAAVVSSFFTVFLKTEGGFGLPPSTDQTASEEEKGEISLGPGAVNSLLPGEDITTADPKRPNHQYEPFVAAVIKEIGGALGLSQEFMLLHFSSSYSAARAAIMQAWRVVLYWRKLVGDYFCTPVYYLFVDEMVAAGVIDIPNYSDFRVRQAYTKHVWRGPGRGSIDELREAKASKIKIAEGISSVQNESEKIEGLDWLDLHNQRVIENDLRDEAGLIKPESAAVVR